MLLEFWRKEQRKLQDESESAKCTFQPDIAINNKINEWAVVSKYEGKQNVTSRLYNLKEQREKLDDRMQS